MESESTEPLRAHVRVTDDVAEGIQRTVTFAEPDRVSELVDAWLRGIVTPEVDPPVDALPEVPATSD